MAPNFICVANIEASDGGQAIVTGNEKVLAARLSDAKFFWEHDLKVPLEEQAKKLDQIVFHEKLGTVADKVERVAKLARWLVEEGIVKPSPLVGEGRVGGAAASAAEKTPTAPDAATSHSAADAAGPPPQSSPTRGEEVQHLAAAAETAARLAKADLVTGMVGEFPELQGLIGGYLARAQGHTDAIADAIRDHYKPVGQGDDVPTAPVTVAVSLADKLDTLFSFWFLGEKPTGSKDPFALRRAALGILAICQSSNLRFPVRFMLILALSTWMRLNSPDEPSVTEEGKFLDVERLLSAGNWVRIKSRKERMVLGELENRSVEESARFNIEPAVLLGELRVFFADRLKVQQREAGVRHDLIDAVFALGGEDDLVRLLARVKALQAFVETPEGADLLAGYKRAANILKKEGWPPLPGREGPGVGASASERSATSSAPPSAAPTPNPSLPGRGNKSLSYTPENEEAALIAALDVAEPRARAAVEAEDFEGAMAALASLRGPVDAFFDKVTVNDPDQIKRTARLNLLARMRAAMHEVADFSKIEG